MKTRQTLFMVTVIALLGVTLTEAASRHTDVDGSVSLSRRLLQINPMPLSQAAGVIHPLRHLLQRAQPTRPSRPANPKASDTASSRWKVMEKWSKKAAAVAKERAFVPNP